MDDPSGARPTRAERLTSNFYAWERRGRGWGIADAPIVLEPPFRPFFHETHAALPTDDVRRPGPVERLLGWLRPRTAGAASPLDDDAAEEDELEYAAECSGDEPIELRVTTPATLDVSREIAERTVLALSGALDPVSFELIASAGRIVLQFACRPDDARAVRQTLGAFTPDAFVEETSGFLRSTWELGRSATSVVDFGLSREFMLPLALPRASSIDPLVALVGALDGLADGEVVVFQALFARTAYPWADSVVRAVTDGAGSSFFADVPQLLAGAREKVSRPLFACAVRAGARSGAPVRTIELLRGVRNALDQLGSPMSNEFLPLDNEGYPDGAHEEDLILRQSRRSGMLLASDELASFVRLPSSSVRTRAIRGPVRKTKAAPASLRVGEVAIGENADRGARHEVRLPSAVRLRHVHIVGATGSGKSTLLKALLRQDISAGRGVALLDPHGDLADEVIALVPESRRDDVVVFDPSDEVAPVGFNVLHAKTEREKELLASDLVAVFRRHATTWGDQMTAVLGNAVLAILEHPEGGTIVDLRRFLVERAFREQMLKSVDDPAVRSFWTREFPLLRGAPQASVLTRLDQFLRPKALRRVVAERVNRLDLADVVERRKIFVGRLAQGAIGEENAHLLGSLLVAKFQQVALARDRTPEHERSDFFLYLDEFHHFVTPSLVALLAGARKYHLGLILAHQELRQLGGRELESALLTNAATRICFRLGDEDARRFADGFASFDARDLQSLAVGDAICRVERADHDFTISVPAARPIERAEADRCIADVRERSRARWGTPREEIDRVLREAYEGDAGLDAVMPAAGEGSKPKPRIDPATSSQSAPAPVPLSAAPTASRRAPRPHVRDSSANPRHDAGRGGAGHKYLQNLVKRHAEERGYRARIEAALPSGGQVDVLLEREKVSIACEISISSTPDQELANIEKCLVGGCTRVAVVSSDRRALRRIEELAVAKLPEATSSRVTFHTPEELLAFLDHAAAEAGTREGVVLGYKVRTTLTPLAPEEQAARQEAIARTIAHSLRRMHGND